MTLRSFSDTTGIRRERERLGASRWGGSLLVLLVAGIPLMAGVHFGVFPDATKPKVIATYSSLDEIPELFDPITQEPLVRYCGDPESEIVFVGKDVEFSPTTGERCWPLTPAVVKMLRGSEVRAQQEAEAEETRRRSEAEAAAREREAEVAREAARRAEEAFKTRYVNGSAVAGLGSNHVAVAISDDGLSRTIAEALRRQGVSVSTNLFTRDLFSGDIFSRLAAGDRSLLSRLGLGSSQATILLGTFEREPIARVGVGNSVNMRGHLTVHVVPLSGGQPVSLPTLSDAGAGFNEEQARQVLYRRLSEALLEEGAIRGLS